LRKENGAVKGPFDIAIIGGGPAGLTAAIYAGRSGMNTVVLEKVVPGGQVATTDIIENYPGFDAITGPELSQKMEEQVKRFGVEIRFDEITSLVNSDGEKQKGPFIIETAGGKIEALTIVIATGAEWRKLGVPGEEELRGKGVSYCATCDGPFFRDEELVVVGGGNTAIQEAHYLTEFAKKIHVVHRRDRLRADQIIQDMAFSNPKIDFIWESVIDEIHGQNGVDRVSLRNIKNGKKAERPCAGVFIFIGLIANTQLFEGFIELDDDGYIPTDDEMRTSRPGVFACGDVRRKLLRQIVTACGDGAIAAYSAREYVEALKGASYPDSFDRE
jgi:thioredoxin reductase (NADPH)